MIKIENWDVVGWEHAIRGARNAMNSWDKMDSEWGYNRPGVDDEFEEDKNNPVEQYKDYGFYVGPNDLNLMKRLVKAGSCHAKFRRMITVYVDITAPLYWWPEMDTYKVGVVRNSCSFMHTGTKKPFEITDFSFKDERIPYILSPLPKKSHDLYYPYETDEYKIFTDTHDRTYRVYKNGLVIREAFDYVDTYGTGRKRHFNEQKAILYQNSSGYYIVKFVGKNGGHMLLHRLIASLWCDRPEGCDQVNHIDGNKGNNSVENLEWVTASENIQKAINAGLYDEIGSLHQRYYLWKYWSRVIPTDRRYEFQQDCHNGMACNELAAKWKITPTQANNVKYGMNKSEYEDLFQECYMWDKLIDQLNYMRGLYLDTKNDQIFQAIRSILPQGYMQRSTLMLNYEVLSNIYYYRKKHRLDEWRELCAWIETLPCSELITGEDRKCEEMSRLRELIKGIVQRYAALEP